LTFQNYAAELAALPGKYTPPSGALLLALDANEKTPLGVIALWPLTPDESTRYCELKRLYTVPEARGRGIAYFGACCAAGYEVAVLDTLSKMDVARGLYASEAFAERRKYYETPLENEAVFVGGSSRCVLLSYEFC
ncbi:hypothetical protein C8R45DRAFT_815764, partial [Mycena sanguinolenta]